MVQSEDRRYCRICELARDVPEEIGVYADRLYQSMPDRERASETQIKERLAVCGTCPHLIEMTCMKCGCYPVIRTMSARAHCPARKW